MKNGAPDLRLVDPGVCGAPTSAGTPCQRPAGDDGTCWEPTHRAKDQDLPPALPEPPEHLGAYGRKLWVQEVRECRDRGILDELPLAYLENMCEALDVRRNLWPDVKKGGTIPGRDGTEKTNPALSKHRKYLTEFRQCCKEWEKMKRAASPSKKDQDGIGAWVT